MGKSSFIQLKENERETRRNLILEAATKLFAKRSFHEIGMRDIAAEAGIAAASIYRYFPSRDDLLVEALTRELGKIEILLESRVEEGKTSIEELAIAVVDYLLNNEATFQMMCHFMTKGEASPESLERYNETQRYFLSLLDRILNHSGSHTNVRFFSHAFFASLVGIIMTFRNYPGRSQQEIRKHLERLALITANIFKKGMT